jgi:tetratricopeptide (TPR) repeat protein
MSEAWFSARRVLMDASANLVDAVAAMDGAELDSPSACALSDLLENAHVPTMIEPGIGRSPHAQLVQAIDILDNAALIYETLIEFDRGDFTALLADCCAFASELSLAVGDHDGALTALEREGRALRAPALATAPARDISMRYVEHRRRYANILDMVHRGDDAVAIYDEAREQAERLLRNSPADESSAAGRALFLVLLDRAVCLVNNMRTAEAAVGFERALTVARTIDERDTDDELARNVLLAHVQYANALDTLERIDEALSSYDHAIAGYEARIESGVDRDTNAEYTSGLLNRAIARARAGVENAAEDFERVIVARKVAAEEDSAWSNRHALAFAYLASARALRRARRFREAERHAEEALTIWQTLIGEEGHVELGSFQYDALIEVGMAGADLGPED